MYIIFVRHGETDYNKKNIVQGQEVNPPINNLGKKQSLITADYLKKFFKISNVFSSPQLRAIQTTDIMTKKLKYNKKIKVIKNLKERKKGIFSGLNKKEVKHLIKNNQKLNEVEKKFKIKNFDFYLNFGSLDKKRSKLIKQETEDNTKKRAKKVLNMIKNNKGDSLIVTHGSFINLLTSELTGINSFLLPKNILKGTKTNCSLTILKLDKGKYNFIKINDNSHLKKLYN